MSKAYHNPAISTSDLSRIVGGRRPEVGQPAIAVSPAHGKLPAVGNGPEFRIGGILGLFEFGGA